MLTQLKKNQKHTLVEADSSPSQINGTKEKSYARFHIWNKSLLENWISFYKLKRIIQ